MLQHCPEQANNPISLAGHSRLDYSATNGDKSRTPDRDKCAQRDLRHDSRDSWLRLLPKHRTGHRNDESTQSLFCQKFRQSRQACRPLRERMNTSAIRHKLARLAAGTSSQIPPQAHVLPGRFGSHRGQPKLQPSPWCRRFSNALQEHISASERPQRRFAARVSRYSSIDAYCTRVNNNKIA